MPDCESQEIQRDCGPEHDARHLDEVLPERAAGDHRSVEADEGNHKNRQCQGSKQRFNMIFVRKYGVARITAVTKYEIPV